MSDIDFESLRRIGLTHTIASQLHLLDHPAPAQLVRIIEIQRDWLTVHDGQSEYKARALPQLMRTLLDQETSLAVGDWVLCETHAQDERWIGAQLPPTSHIARRSADGRRQPLASNVDTALLVMGLDNDFNLRRIERYVALAHAAEVAPVVVLTKADASLDHEDQLRALQQRLPASVPAMAVDGRDPATLAVLAPWLGAGQTLILLGSSGAGKSTLTNTLTGAGQHTGGVRKGDARGRHTTTARSLHLCDSGACIIDTPGLRSLSPDADEETLAATFDDIAALAEQCQFRDCKHAEEPGCAVREAVDPDRLLNYHKLLREARRVQQTPLDRIAERAKWKVVLRAVEARNRNKWR
ncbi:ribosome small subunit-dependent GTPase A [Oxalobacteraceae bacterium]|nr:ribosome small subunit-dependent GTPase A [Oxalobacteraceae bacterium]